MKPYLVNISGYDSDSCRLESRYIVVKSASEESAQSCAVNQISEGDAIKHSGDDFYTSEHDFTYYVESTVLVDEADVEVLKKYLN